MNIVKTDDTATIFNIQRFSLDDGPGIRTIVFFKGCPLRCLWCHNPESQEILPELMLDRNKCTLCGGCVAVCREVCHSIVPPAEDDEKALPRHLIDREKCRKCGACIKTCPRGALALAGRTVTLDEVMEEVRADKIFYDQSGGGMTLSGGEPLYHGAFSVALCRAAKSEGINTAVETCGFGNTETLLELAEYTDYFLFDYKAEPADYRRFTGAGFELIEKNLRALSDRGADITLRCPIIPDMNDSDEHYSGIARLAAELSGVSGVTLEAYHPLGISKAERLDRTQGYANSGFLDKALLVPVCRRIAEESGKPCNIG